MTYGIMNENDEMKVRMGGLEPPRLSPPDPKSGAATNYATPAFFRPQKYTFFRHFDGLSGTNFDGDRQITKTATFFCNILSTFSLSASLLPYNIISTNY